MFDRLCFRCLHYNLCCITSPLKKIGTVEGGAQLSFPPERQNFFSLNVHINFQSDASIFKGDRYCIQFVYTLPDLLDRKVWGLSWVNLNMLSWTCPPTCIRVCRISTERSLFTLFAFSFFQSQCIVMQGPTTQTSQ